MLVFVAGTTKSDSIRRIASKFGVFRPRLDVMGLEIVGRIASLATITSAGEHPFSPTVHPRSPTGVTARGLRGAVAGAGTVLAPALGRLGGYDDERSAAVLAYAGESVLLGQSPATLRAIAPIAVKDLRARGMESLAAVLTVAPFRYLGVFTGERTVRTTASNRSTGRNGERYPAAPTDQRDTGRAFRLLDLLGPLRNLASMPRAGVTRSAHSATDKGLRLTAGATIGVHFLNSFTEFGGAMLRAVSAAPGLSCASNCTIGRA